MLKIGVVYDRAKQSLGDHGTHLAFRGLPADIVDQAALADSGPDAEKNRAEIGARLVYTDFREMMDVEKPDIIVIGSREPASHLDPIEEAAKRGIHILCEKPLCATLEEADHLAELAEKHRIKIAVAHLARHSNLFGKMKEMVDSGAIGTPLSVYGRGKEDERGGGEDMMVLGTHILDAMCWIFGKPENLFAEVLTDGRGLKPADRSETKEPIGPAAGDNLFAHFHFSGQVRGFFESRKGLFKKNGPVRMGITVVGTDGALSMRYTHQGKKERTLRLTRSSFPVEDEAVYEIVPLREPPKIPGAEPLPSSGQTPYFAVNNRLAAWDLIQAIREDRQPLASVHDAVTVLELIQGIYLSQLNGRRISLPLQHRKHPLEG